MNVKIGKVAATTALNANFLVGCIGMTDHQNLLLRLHCAHQAAPCPIMSVSKCIDDPMQVFARFDKSKAFYLVLRQYIAYVWTKIP